MLPDSELLKALGYTDAQCEAMTGNPGARMIGSRFPGTELARAPSVRDAFAADRIIGDARRLNSRELQRVVESLWELLQGRIRDDLDAINGCPTATPSVA